MPLVFRVAVALALAAASATSALTVRPQPDIRADTNRDGIVDVTGSSDVHGKYMWSRYRGAIFLPNIGDADQRCTDVDARGNPLSNTELAACNDALGDTAISPEYLAPLRTMPMPDIGDHAHAHVTAHPEEQAPHVRIFWREHEQANWTFIDPEFRFNASAIRAGLTLGIDSRRLVTDAAEWDGLILVRFTVISDHDAVDADEVALKLAPVLFHHHLQAVDELVTQSSNQSSNAHKRFVSELDAARAKTSVVNPLLTLPDDDVWVQDIMEPAYSSMPGPDGKPISIRVLVRTAQSTRTAGRQVFTKLRGKGVGGFQPTGKGTFGFREINSGGNIETIPPHVSKVTGDAYPAGRIITGKHHELLPAHAMLTFYKSQQLQMPLVLETGWLMIGHVDEFVSFLPANNSLGFTISVADPLSALALLREANASGHGATSAYSVGPNPDPSLLFGRDRRLNLTIADILSGPETNETVQAYADKYIQANLAVLLAETGLSEADVIRIPTLFAGSSQTFFPDGFAPWDPPGSPPHYTVPERNGWALMSFYPAAINGVVLGRSYIGARAFGPVINGTDILQAAVEAAYQRAGMDAHFIDDFYSHHSMGGEVHCGTNTFRETAIKWW